MKLENVRNVNIKIDKFEPFEFSYAELTSIELTFTEEGQTITIDVKPYEGRLLQSTK